MSRNRYIDCLEKVTHDAGPARGSEDELRERLSEINAQLKGPLSNAERIELCGERASIRKGLEAQKVEGRV